MIHRDMHYRILSFLKYLLYSRHARGFGIHSPFVYDFIINVLNNKDFPAELDGIEGIRSSLLRSNEYICINDLGSGQGGKEPIKRSVDRITKVVATKRKYGRLLFQIMKYFDIAKVLELGTSLGFGSMYLGMANPTSEVITIDGCEKCLKVAKQNFATLGLTNIKVMNGAFKDILPHALSELEWVDLVFFDGDHRKTPLLYYFDTVLPFVRNNSLFIIDDIHWSGEMEEAWETIKNHPDVKVTLDLYQFGIVFFREELHKQNFLVRFM